MKALSSSDSYIINFSVSSKYSHRARNSLSPHISIEKRTNDLIMILNINYFNQEDNINLNVLYSYSNITRKGNIFESENIHQQKLLIKIEMKITTYEYY